VALRAVHAAGVVHRDVKPENVLLDRASQPGGIVPKVTDFGVAKLVDQSASTRRTSVIGTPEYMAPELIDDSEPTPASDLYGVGIMLYELLCGVTPFSGGSPLAVLRKHVEFSPGRPAGIPDQMWAVVVELVAKDPAARPRSAALVATGLDSMLASLAPLPALPRLTEPPAPVPDGQTVLRSPAGVGSGAAAVGAAPAGAAGGHAARAGSGRGSRRVQAVVAGAVALVLLVAGIAFAVSRGGGSGSTAGAGASTNVSTGSSATTTPSVASSPTDTSSPTASPTDSPTVGGIAMPDVVGQNVADASATLSSLGLLVTENDILDAADPDGTVKAEDPPSGQPAGSTVTLTVGRHAVTTWLADLGAVGGSPQTGPQQVNGPIRVHALSEQQSCYSGSGDEWDYDLSRNQLRLSGAVGLSDNSDATARETVEIYADGQLLFRAGVRLGHAATYNVNLTHALRLRIVLIATTCAQQTSATVVLVDPQLSGLPVTASPAP
jgi:hypothetical protein